MKVLHVINTLSAGGAELHLLTLCRHLKVQGVEVVVACLKESVEGSRPLRQDFEGDGVRVVNLEGDRRFSLRCLIRLIRLLKNEKPDVLHTHLPRADFAGAIGHFFFPSAPWICSIHDVYSKSWSGKYFLPLFNLLWLRANIIIAISQGVKDWLVQTGRIPLKKVKVVHYGIESERFGTPNCDLRKEWGLNGKAIIGSIGRLERRKGHETLIRAMPIILKQVPNACLLIAGHDPWGYRKTLKRTIDELKLNEQAQYVGFQTDIPSFLHSLNVFAFASSSEGFGQVVIEAMAAAKPVVASKIPPFTEIITNGETGILVELGNADAFARAITCLIKNPEEAGRLAFQARERVRNDFSGKTMADKILSLYGELVGDHYDRIPLA